MGNHFVKARGGWPLVSLMPALAMLNGCAAFSGYPTSYQNEADILAADKPYLTADVRTKGNDPSDAARNGLTQQQYRDTVLYRRIEVIDSYYYDFEAKLTGSYNGFEVGADLSTLVLNGFGAVTGSAGTKAALAAASAGVIGAKSTISTDIFYQKTLPSLVAQMRASRQQMLLKIETGILNPVSKYSIDQALNDINAYYIAGTLPSAISQITSQAGAALKTASSGIDELRTTTYHPLTSTGQKIANWLYPTGDRTQPPDSTKLTKLSGWMQGYKADPLLAQVPYLLLLNDPSFEADRAQAIQDLGIP
jgi:hypothetical protein